MQCCPLGSDCGNKCPPGHYLANVTETLTTTLAAVIVVDDTAETLTSSQTTTTISTSSACSPRSCTSTQYLCAESFGGGCCPYGFNCASSGQCIGTSSTVSASSSSSVSPLVTPVPSGCSAQGQTRCTAGAGISGAGCCDAGYACITVSLNLMCSATPSSSSATATAPDNVTVEHPSDKSSSLSTGAKAGIGIGVILAAAVVIGALTWFCLRRCHRSGQSTTTGNEMRSVPPHDDNNNNNTPGVGAVGAVGAAYPTGSAGRPPFGPATRRNMSETSGYAPSSTQVSRDYFGGSDYNNEYYDGGVEDSRTWESGLATAGTPLANEQGYYSQNDQQAPHGPGHVVAAPVEIGHGGDGDRRRGYSNAGSDGGQSELADTSSAAPRRQGGGNNSGGGAQVRDSIAERFELHGSEARGGTGTVGTYLPQPFPTPGSEMSEFGTPSPMSGEEEGQQQRRRRDI